MMNRSVQSPADELQYVAEVLVKHWVLALPTAVASVALVFVVFIGILSVVASVIGGHAAAGHAGTVLGLGSGLIIAATLFVFAIAGLYIAQAMVIAASPAAFAGLPPNFGTALRITLARLPQLLVLGLASFALALVPMALSIVLVGIPLLFLLGYFLMFAPAAVIVGNETGIEAIKTSFRIATQNVGESFICWCGTILALIAGAVANGIAVHIPLVNLIAGFAIGGFTSAYAALLTSRFYEALRDRIPASVQAAATTTNPYSGPPTIIR